MRRLVRAWSRVGSLSIVIVLVVLLGASAASLGASQAQSRDQLRSRFAQRAVIGARFVDAYLHDFAGRESSLVARGLHNDELSKADFEQIVASLQVDAAVYLDVRGRLAHVWPRNEALIGAALTEKYAHLAAAHQGRIAVSKVVPSAARGEPVVAVAVPIATSQGTVVFSGAFAASATPLGAYATNTVSIPGSNIYVVDQDGTVVAGNVANHRTVSLRKVNAGLSRAAASVRSGGFDGDAGPGYFTMAPVTGTGWRVIVAVPNRTLLAPVSGLSSLVPWLILGGLAAIAGVVLYLLFRLRREQRQLAATNHELAAASTQVEVLAAGQRELLARSSHELRTPLTSILGYLEEVLDTPGAVTGESEEHVRTAHRNAQRLHALVDDLLTLDQIDTTKVDLQATAVTVSELLDPVARDFEVLCIRKRVRLVTSSAPPRRELLVDVRRTQQILANLLSNALKHTDAGGTLAIACHEDGDNCAIVVSDTGCGIAPDEVAKVFDPFFRSSASTRAAIPGTGLGLPIARSLAEAQGGSITVASVAGEGTAFTLTVPFARIPSEVAQ